MSVTGKTQTTFRRVKIAVSTTYSNKVWAITPSVGQPSSCVITHLPTGFSVTKHLKEDHAIQVFRAIANQNIRTRSTKKASDLVRKRILPTLVRLGAANPPLRRVL